MVAVNTVDNQVNPEQVTMAMPDLKAGQIVVNALTKYQRARKTIDLRRLFWYIRDEVKANVSESDIVDVFKFFESEGAGRLVIGRKNRPNRFHWNYNLKEAADALMNNRPLSELKQLKRSRKFGSRSKSQSVETPVKTETRQVKRRGRPRTTNSHLAPVPMQAKPEPSPQTNADDNKIVINIVLPKNASREDIAAFLELAKDIRI